MNAKLLIGSLLLVACVGSIAGSGRAQGIGDRNRPQGINNLRISGKVVLPDGTPGKDVTVNIVGTETSASSVRTNSAGEFEFSGLGNGNYTVSIRVAGFNPETETVNIEGSAAGQSYPVVFYLKLATSVNPLMKDVPREAVSQYQKGMDKATSGDWKGALADFDAAIAAYANFAAAYYERGTAYLKEKDLDKALESFVKAIQIKSDYLEAKYSVGYVQYLKNNFEVSAAIFDDVLKDKQMPEAHLYLGISLAKLHNLDAAVPHFKAAIAAKDDESMALAHRYLGGIYMQKKQNADAAAELEKYLKLVPKAPDADKLRSTIADLRKQT